MQFSGSFSAKPRQGDMMNPDPSATPDPPAPLLPHEATQRSRQYDPNPQSAANPVFVVQQPQRSLFRSVLGWMGWLGVFLCLPVVIGMASAYRDYFDRSHGIQEKYHSLSRHAPDKVAIIDVSGVIMEGDGFVKHQIDRIRDDDHIKAVVVRVDSPGGTITGSDYIYHHLTKLKADRQLPIVVSMGSIAASGGYYVAMAVGDTENSIFAEPTTTTGSIGVIIPHYDLSGLLERMDIKNDSIATHPRKQMLSMTRPMSDDDRQILERYLGEAFDRFKETVKAGRPQFRNADGALDKLATGEIFAAKIAAEQGLVDKIGFIEDAIERAIELAGLNKDAVRVVEFKKPSALIDAFAAAQARAATTSWDARSLLEMSTPRAYYLATSWPPLVSTWPRE
jgi:protease-4